MSLNYPDFNLLDDPFITVIDHNNERSLVGLLELIKDAHRYSAILGDTPFQELSLIRLVIAVLYSAYGSDLHSEEDWFTLYETESFPSEPLDAWAETYRSRFELFGETPFYQVPNAEWEKPRKPSNESLFIQFQGTQINVRTTTNFFTGMTPRGIAKVEFAEAARALIELQGYRTAAKKSPLAGFDKSYVKRDYGQAGWLSTMTAIVLTSNTLKNTLLLNTPPLEVFKLVDHEADKAVWEREPLTIQRERNIGSLGEYGLVTGPKELLTFQIARPTLYTEGDKVVNTVVGIGDRLFKANQHLSEFMCSWIERTREDKTQAYFPVKTSNPEAWRGLEALLARREGHQQELSKNVAFLARTTDYLKEIGTTLVTLKTFGSTYGTQDAIVEDAYSSSVMLPVLLLAPENSGLLTQVINAANTGNYVARIIAGLQEDIYVASGKERSPVKGVSALKLAANVQQRALSDIGEAFSEWVIGVTTTNTDEKFIEWHKTLNDISKEHGDRIIKGASPRSLKGSVGDNGSEKVFTAFDAHNKFNAKLRKVLS